MNFLSGIWAKVIAAGIVIGAVLAAFARAFAKGEESGRREVEEEVNRAANEYEGRADEARRAGEIREREVKNESKPADYSRYH